jgi:hypothetical protein
MKYSPEAAGQRLTFLIQKEQQQDRETDDESVSDHELSERLRPPKERGRICSQRPRHKRPWVRELALPTGGRPGSYQGQVLKP